MEHILSIFTDKANLLGAVVVAVMTGVFGAHWQVFALFAALNVIDFFYGWLKGKQTGTINSAKGAVGIMKKVSYWVVIAMAFGVAQVLIDFGTEIDAQLGFLHLIGWFTLGVYILNELTSIVENLVVLGYEVPEIFVRSWKRLPISHLPYCLHMVISIMPWVHRNLQMAIAMLC